MKQMVWHANILGSGAGHFVYASTLATYAHRSADGRLARLQTVHERTVTGLSWGPPNQGQYVTAGADMRVVRWSLDSELEQSSLTLPNIPLMVDWSGSAAGVAILLKSGEVSVWNPLVPNAPNTSIPALQAGPGSFNTCVRWNHPAPNEASIFALGRADGTVIVWDHTAQKVLHSFDALASGIDGVRGGEVLDLAWDPLSNTYLLATFKSGLLLLLDTQTGQVLQEFTRPVHPASMVLFLPQSPGEFLTLSGASNTLTLWNVSQQRAKEVIKVAGATGGMLAMRILNQQPESVSVAASSAASAPFSAASSSCPPRLLLAFLNGSVGVFDWSVRHLDFLTTPAHSETIFDVRFKPSPSSASTLATASYDGRVKVWNTDRMEQLQELRGQGGVLYAVTWAPGGEEEHRLASGGSEGDVFVWDVRTGQVLTRAKHHSKPVYSVKWHPRDPELLASASSDGYVVIFTPAGKVVRKLKHPAACYGVDWSPHHPGMLATTCHDGVVRVWDVSGSGSSKEALGNKPVLELAGHTARSFNVAWSPLVPDRLASGSDDKTIRVWDTSAAGSSKPPQVLLGHTHNVRGITWSHEIPFVLLSGSWDGSIRVWDSRTGEVMHVVQEHAADVYGLDSHPLRPFTFVSSSRDTSLRFWGLDESPSAAGGLRVKIQALLAEGGLQPSHVADVKSVMKIGAAVRLCGAASRALVVPPTPAGAVPSIKELLERHARLFGFFTNVPGGKELWRLMEALVHHKATDASSTPASLLHLNDVRPAALASARALYAARNSSVVGLGKRSDRLRTCAGTYLSLGHVREYCEIHVALGDWDRAIAFAPGVSMSYWKLLMLRRAFTLSAGGDARGASEFFMASGETALLLEHQLRTKDVQGAFLTAVCEANGDMPMLPPLEPEEDKVYASLLAAHTSPTPSSALASASASIPFPDQADPAKPPERDELPVTDHIRQVGEVQSLSAFNASQPIRAACALLRLGDAMGVVQRLLAGNETLLALGVVRVLQLPQCDEVFLRTASLAEEVGLYDEALKALLCMREPQEHVTLLAARFVGPANLKAEFFVRAGLRSAEAFGQQAEQQIKDKQHVDALTSLVASGQGDRALHTGMELLAQLLSQPSWSLEEAQALLRPLHSVHLPSLGNSPAAHELRTQLLLFSYALGSYTAAARGYLPVLSFLVDSFAQLGSRLSAQGVAPLCPLPLALLRMQEASSLQSIDPARASALLKDVLSEASLSPKLKAAATLLKKNVDAALAAPAAVRAATAAAASKAMSKQAVVPSGSHMPTGGNGGKAVVSIVSHAPIEGPKLPAEPATEGSSAGATAPDAFVSVAEAIMLQQCTPFAPTHSGARMQLLAQ